MKCRKEEVDSLHPVADTGIRQWGGRLCWRGGIFQRRRNVFNIGGGRLCKIINGGGGGLQSAYDGEGAIAYDGGGAVHFWHTKYVLLTVTVLQSARNEVIW